MTTTNDTLQLALACIKYSTEYKMGNPAFEHCEAALAAALTQQAASTVPKRWKLVPVDEPTPEAAESETVHRYVLELPDGDTRSARVAWSEREAKGGEIQHHLCVVLSGAAPEASKTLSQRMRDAGFTRRPSINTDDAAPEAEKPTKGLFIDMIQSHGPEFVAEMAEMAEVRNIPPHILADSIEDPAHATEKGRPVKVHRAEKTAVCNGCLQPWHCRKNGCVQPQQAQEPEVVSILDGAPLITLQSHREAIAKKDAELDAALKDRVALAMQGEELRATVELALWALQRSATTEPDEDAERKHYDAIEQLKEQLK